MLAEGGFPVSRAGRRRRHGKGHSRMRRHRDAACSGGMAGRGCSLLRCWLRTRAETGRPGWCRSPLLHVSGSSRGNPRASSAPGHGKGTGDTAGTVPGASRFTKPLLEVGMGQGWCPTPGLHMDTGCKQSGSWLVWIRFFLPAGTGAQRAYSCRCTLVTLLETSSWAESLKTSEGHNNYSKRTNDFKFTRRNSVKASKIRRPKRKEVSKPKRAPSSYSRAERCPGLPRTLCCCEQEEEPRHCPLQCSPGTWELSGRRRCHPSGKSRADSNETENGGNITSRKDGKTLLLKSQTWRTEEAVCMSTLLNNRQTGTEFHHTPQGASPLSCFLTPQSTSPSVWPPLQ